MHPKHYLDWQDGGGWGFDSQGRARGMSSLASVLLSYRPVELTKRCADQAWYLLKHFKETCIIALGPLPETIITSGEIPVNFAGLWVPARIWSASAETSLRQLTNQFLTRPDICHPTPWPQIEIYWCLPACEGSDLVSLQINFERGPSQSGVPVFFQL